MAWKWRGRVSLQCSAGPAQRCVHTEPLNRVVCLQCAAECERRAAGKPPVLSEGKDCGGVVPEGAGEWSAFARDLWEESDLGERK